MTNGWLNRFRVRAYFASREIRGFRLCSLAAAALGKRQGREVVDFKFVERGSKEMPFICSDNWLWSDMIFVQYLGFGVAWEDDLPHLYHGKLP